MARIGVRRAKTRVTIHRLQLQRPPPVREPHAGQPRDRRRWCGGITRLSTWKRRSRRTGALTAAITRPGERSVWVELVGPATRRRHRCWGFRAYCRWRHFSHRAAGGIARAPRGRRAIQPRLAADGAEQASTRSARITPPLFTKASPFSNAWGRLALLSTRTPSASRQPRTRATPRRPRA